MLSLPCHNNWNVYTLPFMHALLENQRRVAKQTWVKGLYYIVGLYRLAHFLSYNKQANIPCIWPLVFDRWYIIDWYTFDRCWCIFDCWYIFDHWYLATGIWPLTAYIWRLVLDRLYAFVCWLLVFDHLYLTACTWPPVLDHLYLTACTWPPLLDCLYLTTCTWPPVLDRLYHHQPRTITNPSQ